MAINVEFLSSITDAQNGIRTLERNIQGLVQRTGNLGTAVDRANLNRLNSIRTSTSQQQIDQLTRSVTTLEQRTRNAVRVMQAGFLALGASGVTRAADSWVEYANKLSAAETLTQQHLRSTRQLMAVSRDNNASLRDTVGLYSRIAMSSSEMGLSERDILDITSTVSRGLKVGGADAAEVSATITQLGQALGSGKLQGDELRSIRENAVLLAQAIADQMGVTIGELTELGKEGKISAEDVAIAILNSKDRIDAAYSATVSTVGDATRALRDSFGYVIDQLMNATGASQLLVGAINSVTNAMTWLGDVLGGTVIAGMRDFAEYTVTVSKIFLGLGWDYIRESVSGLGDSIRGLWSGFMTSEQGQAAFAALGTSMAALGAITGNVRDRVLGFLGSIRDSVRAIDFGALWDQLRIDYIAPILDQLADRWRSMWRSVMDNETVSQITGVISNLVRGIQAALQPVTDAVMGVLRPLWDAVVAGFQWVYTVLVGASIVPDTVNEIIDWFGRLPEALMGIMRRVRDTLVSGFNSATRGMTRLLDSLFRPPEQFEAIQASRNPLIDWLNISPSEQDRFTRRALEITAPFLNIGKGMMDSINESDLGPPMRRQLELLGVDQPGLFSSFKKRISDVFTVENFDMIRSFFFQLPGRIAGTVKDAAIGIWAAFTGFMLDQGIDFAQVKELGISFVQALGRGLKSSLKFVGNSLADFFKGLDTYLMNGMLSNIGRHQNIIVAAVAATAAALSSPTFRTMLKRAVPAGLGILVVTSLFQNTATTALPGSIISGLVESISYAITGEFEKTDLSMVQDKILKKMMPSAEDFDKLHVPGRITQTVDNIMSAIGVYTVSAIMTQFGASEDAIVQWGSEIGRAVGSAIVVGLGAVMMPRFRGLIKSMFLIASTPTGADRGRAGALLFRNILGAGVGWMGADLFNEIFDIEGAAATQNKLLASFGGTLALNFISGFFRNCLVEFEAGKGLFNDIGKRAAGILAGAAVGYHVSGTAGNWVLRNLGLDPEGLTETQQKIFTAARVVSALATSAAGFMASSLFIARPTGKTTDKGDAIYAAPISNLLGSLGKTLGSGRWWLKAMGSLGVGYAFYQGLDAHLKLDQYGAVGQGAAAIASLVGGMIASNLVTQSITSGMKGLSGRISSGMRAMAFSMSMTPLGSQIMNAMVPAGDAGLNAPTFLQRVRGVFGRAGNMIRRAGTGAVRGAVGLAMAEGVRQGIRSMTGAELARDTLGGAAANFGIDAAMLRMMGLSWKTSIAGALGAAIYGVWEDPEFRQAWEDLAQGVGLPEFTPDGFRDMIISGFDTFDIEISEALGDKIAGGLAAAIPLALVKFKSTRVGALGALSGLIAKEIQERMFPEENTLGNLISGTITGAITGAGIGSMGAGVGAIPGAVAGAFVGATGAAMADPEVEKLIRDSVKRIDDEIRQAADQTRAAFDYLAEKMNEGVAFITDFLNNLGPNLSALFDSFLSSISAGWNGLIESIKQLGNDAYEAFAYARIMFQRGLESLNDAMNLGKAMDAIEVQTNKMQGRVNFGEWFGGFKNAGVVANYMDSIVAEIDRGAQSIEGRKTLILHTINSLPEEVAGALRSATIEDLQSNLDAAMDAGGLSGMFAGVIAQKLENAFPDINLSDRIAPQLQQGLDQSAAALETSSFNDKGVESFESLAGGFESGNQGQIQAAINDVARGIDTSAYHSLGTTLGAQIANGIRASTSNIVIKPQVASVTTQTSARTETLMLANGGQVYGPGGPRDDIIPAMLSAGEFVVNARSASRYRPLLDAINRGSVLGFADGTLPMWQDKPNASWYRGAGDLLDSVGWHKAASAVRGASRRMVNAAEELAAGTGTAAEATTAQAARVADSNTQINQSNTNSVNKLESSARKAKTASEIWDEVADNIQSIIDDAKASREAMMSDLYGSQNLTYQEMDQLGADSNQQVQDAFKGALSGMLKFQGKPKEIFLGFLDQLTGQIIDTFVDGMVQGLWNRFNLGEKIAKFFQNVMTQAFSIMSGGMGGGGGDLLGSLLSGIIGGAKADPLTAALAAIPGVFAEGGWVGGHGTGTSDSMVARVSKGEFVVNAAAARAHGDLLTAINGGRVNPQLINGEYNPGAGPAIKNSSSTTNNVAISVTGDVSKQTRREILGMIPEIHASLNKYSHDRGLGSTNRGRRGY